MYSILTQAAQHAYPGDSIMAITFLAPHNPSHDPSLSPWARSWLSTCKALNMGEDGRAPRQPNG
ncbi:hypothetical protein CPAR01_02631 [Colletotrichum paranaense]|uniref:Uncharacterized protein n=2 Tax=Colletotrichum acutatum species complex TaxID=2707335 RepID=A0ABQ9T056_9PEZI|nr:uncharacterized protein CPAR01_02631 [Colletotrichum paranaense]XP_060374332.1 uncharacterized protein CTAM01_15090 [Colletotrichum tamarilloi]XP_060405328.1 uncharacterized protein CABS01_05698 [Colletotrichum abscissum]KAI3540162.1 hypothetical protein CSPX01_08351 [Colletotrichum filicis]KAK1477705.1 hypothetical protein CTAM01_15090 [Colletotrichum tamarilloi]KAK1521193.1 hypothetical protein CABS01_05698 [Colletotrichum abscissum]KAK1545129.1 hypothetical protein CPAR01_02631 [Colleto